MRGPETDGLPVAVTQPEKAEPAPTPNDFWVSADYLYWWLSSAPVPALLTTRTPLNGDVNQQTLIGSSLGRYDPFSGLHLEAGIWLDNDHNWAVTGSGFFIENRSSTLSVNGGAGQSLDRPFTNAVTGQPIIVPVSAQDLLLGGVAATSSIEFGGRSRGGARASMLLRRADVRSRGAGRLSLS